MPRLSPDDPEGLPDVITRTDALRLGFTADQIRQRVRSGRWIPLAPGVYRRTSSVVPFDRFQAERAHHSQLAYAAAMRHPGSIIALESAAVLHGLPLVSQIPTRPQLMSSIGTRRGDAASSLHRHALTEDDVMEIEPSVWVTTPLRTWLDVTRRGQLSDSLAVGDHALRFGAFTIDMAQAAASDARGRHCRLIKSAAKLIDARRESALESFSFARFVEWQLPRPQMQVEIADSNGLLIARVDFAWEGTKVIGEADGAWKYADTDDLYAEKRREDALRARGFVVIRWGWQDLRNGMDLRWRLAAALRDAAPPRRVRPYAS